MEILYRDAQVAVCVKPVGLSSQDDPVSVPAELRMELGGEIFPVHRLDLNVGGVMVYARTRPAAAKLSQSIQEGQLQKEYLALTHGCPEPLEGSLKDLLWKDSSKNKVFVVKRSRRGVKEARLSYRVLDRKSDGSLVQILLDTGRSHQIRVQFASRKWPLVGDHKYGSRDSAESPALWSYRLTFPHPKTGRPLCFSCLPTEDRWKEFSLPEA